MSSTHQPWWTGSETDPSDWKWKRSLIVCPATESGSGMVDCEYASSVPSSRLPMLVYVAPSWGDSSPGPKSHGQPAPPFVSLSESCFCQNPSLTVFAPAGTVIDGLVRS